MGSFREKSREGIKEMQENSRETTELGTEMTEQADQINAVLESIELQDEEDVQYINGEKKRLYLNCMLTEPEILTYAEGKVGWKVKIVCELLANR